MLFTSPRRRVAPRPVFTPLRPGCTAVYTHDRLESVVRSSRLMFRWLSRVVAFRGWVSGSVFISCQVAHCVPKSGSGSVHAGNTTRRYRSIAPGVSSWLQTRCSWSLRWGGRDYSRDRDRDRDFIYPGPATLWPIPKDQIIFPRTTQNRTFLASNKWQRKTPQGCCKCVRGARETVVHVLVGCPKLCDLRPATP
jgi:hypothetical protein